MLAQPPSNEERRKWQESSRLAKFSAVGAIGFAVDAGILSLLVALTELGPYLARVPSFAAAVSVTWFLNRHFSFRDVRRLRPGGEYSAYVVSQVLGALVNFAVYVLLIAWVPMLAAAPIVPLAFGSAAGLVFNFGVARRYVFREKSR